nr:hydrocephalus-inducing protein homolog isoform X3 [Osmia lignaria]
MNEEINDKILKESKLFSATEIIQYLLERSDCKKNEDEKGGAIPSEYMRQMSMTTEERTRHLFKLRNKFNYFFFCPEDCNFEITPSVVIFQQFTVGNALTVTVTVQNKTKIPRYLKTSCELDPCFSVEHRGSTYSMMIAPGLANCYNVKFTPEKKRDYQYLLKFTTDSGQMIVPVIAIGSRGILDFPDRIELPSTAVKIPSTKTIFVRNVGNAEAIFTLYTNDSRFWIEPSKGRIEEEESLQFTVYFSSNKAGDFQGKLFLEYETGEKLQIDLQGSAENCTIRIDRGSVRMEETYLGLSRSKTLTIHNRSDYIVKYKWMLLKDEDEDKKRKEEYKKLYHMVYDAELIRCVDLEYYNVCTPDIHKLIYQRIYADELESLTKESFPYNHLFFIFAPQEGEIWPRSSTGVTVFYRAIEIGEVTSIAYLEVTGLENRIPLSLYGIGKGPVLRLNVLTIDVANIYLCSVHNYEIIVANKGHIPGTLVHKPKPSDFGGTIEITPICLTLEPNQHKSFNLSFSSNRKGDFVERVDFVVKESLEVLSLHIKGCIVCPTLHFDKDSLEFATTALGFSTRHEVNLNNLSLMPVAFTITVLDDGDQPPLTHEEFTKAPTKYSFPSNPREFHIIPEEGVVSAQDVLKIKITYIANIARAGHTIIQVDMKDSDLDPLQLPVKFYGRVASLLIVPSDIVFRFCFINFPYSRSFTVKNTSDLDGYFYILPQQVTEHTAVICSLSVYQGYIKANQSKTINVTIITKVLGTEKVTLNMLTMGEKSSSTICIVTCTGQGPVISVEPIVLDFGDIQVLEEKTMELLVINDSPIPAHFNGALEKMNSLWTMDPESGDLEPDKTITITVKLFLRDVGKFRNTVLLSVLNSRTIHVEIKVTGIGCSVVFDPSIFPVYDLGLLFSHHLINRTITLTNYGTRAHQIIWANEPEIQFYRGQILQTKSSKFQLHPMILDIPAEESRVVQCNLSWEQNECVLEDWYVFATIQGKGKRELIGKSIFKATLTKPQILFSKRELTFRVDVCPEGDKSQQKDELLVTNQSNLDLNVQLSVKTPFYLLTTAKERVQSMKVILIDKATTNISVFFFIDEQFKDLYSRVDTGQLLLEYMEHPNQDKIPCKAYVNFPNLIIEPKDIVIDCELGCSAEKVLALTNNGPVTVVYKFLWIADSIEIDRDTNSDQVCPECSPPQTGLDFYKMENRKSDDVCVNDRQDGSGDGPLQSIQPPTNSPVSETLKLKPEVSSANDSETNDCTVTAEEMREFLMPIFGKYFLEDEDIVVLKNLSFEPPKDHYINEVVKIVPREGTVPPYSVHHVYLGFHGFQRLRVQAKAVCEILRGPTEEIRLIARADVTRFSIDTDVINFGQQMFLGSTRKSFALRNLGTTTFQYKINGTILPSSNEKIDRLDMNSLKVEPYTGYVDPQLFVEIQVEHCAEILGPIHHRFQLEINHLMPVTVKVIAYGAFPQVYPCIPKGKLHQYHSVELEYFAIQSLTEDFFINMLDDINFKEGNDLPKEDIETLTNEGWCIISYEETFPRVMDIDMAVERHLARKFVDANSYILIQYASRQKNQPIPQLFSTEYIIDMNYVIVDCVAHYSAKIINYGPWDVEMRMKETRRKEVLAKSGILVQFKKHSKLVVDDSAVLHITWHPTRERFSVRSTPVRHTIHIQVIHGCTIPIVIQGIVTYPYITVNTKLLDFQEVVVGECLVLSILMKNEGLIDCKWEAKLSGTRKKQQETYPFYVQYNSNHIPPGHEEIIRINFKPQQTCNVEAKLKIIVKFSLESQVITLIGRGIEKHLNVIEPDIQFEPIVPFTKIQETIFTIENPCDYPVEFFWHHLDDSFQTEDQIIKTLLYYYQAKEIFLPPRKPGDSIPTSFFQFYEQLVNEMARTMVTEEPEGTLLEDEQSDVNERKETDAEQERTSKFNLSKRRLRKRDSRSTKRSRKKTSVRGSSRHGKRSDIFSEASSIDLERNDCPTFSILNESVVEFVPLPTSDPEEIQRLLFCYIDALYQTPDILNKLKDPVKELFNDSEEKSDDLPDPSKPMKRVCIIFHGAPFTGYQETACKSARALQIPVLNIDNAITEIIALGGNSCSIQLRQIIDDAYENYSEDFERHKNRLNMKVDRKEGTESPTDAETQRDEVTNEPSSRTKSSRTKSSRNPSSKKSSPKKGKSSRSNKTDTSNAQQEVFLKLHAESDYLKELNKVPAIDVLELLDPLSRYEYKIQGLLLLEKILDGGSPRKKQNASFLGIAQELLVEAVEERLSMEDFESGFVLQSLESNFLCNSVVDVLLLLLRIIGHVEYFLFVTFFNSMANYNSKVGELRREQAEKMVDVGKKIQDIREMTSSQYDLLSEQDKKLYLDAILPVKRAEAAKRKARYLERMMEHKKKKEVRGRVTNSKTSKVKENPKSKSGKINSKKSTNSKHSSKRDTTGSKATRSRDSPRQKKGVPTEVKEITMAMDQYYLDLLAIKNVISNWDPIKKILLQESPSSAKSRIPKSAKSKDVGILDTAREKQAPINNFHVWYVRSSDPWQDKIYDMVTGQMSQNSLAKSALPIEVVPEPDLEPKLYSILKTRNFEKRSSTIDESTYQLVSISSVPEIPSVVESIYPSELSMQENRAENRRNRKSRGQRRNKAEEQRSSKTEDFSLIASTIDSIDTNNVSNLETILEEPLKARWILLPKECHRFKIRFQPEVTGFHEQMYAFTIVDGNNITYQVNVNGIADVPKLDMNPKTIFAKTANSKLNETYIPTYFLDSGIYDFGTMLVLRKDKRPHRREAELKFCNISKVDVELHFFLAKNNPECFFVQSEELLIAAGNSESLVLSTIATKFGIISEKLYLCVKNNPKVEVIELQHEGTKLDIELEKKQISFDRVLLYRMEYQSLIVRNKSAVPLFWSLKAEEPAEAQITFSPSEGTIEQQGEQKVEFCYHGTKVGVTEKKATIFEAFLYEEDKEAIFTDTILLTGETYDVQVDINYANPIDLNYIKVGFPTTGSFTIKNRGNYEVKYVITLEEKEKLEQLNLPKNLKKDLQVQPVSGSIPSKKERIVEVVFVPKAELSLKNAPILKCHLLDTQKGTAIIAEIPLTVSLIAYYTRFRVHPYPLIDFGTLAICTEKTMYLNIENTGKYQLCYTIFNPLKHPSVLYMSQTAKQVAADSAEKWSKRKKKSPRNDKSHAKDSLEVEHLTMGPMTVTKMMGQIEPGETDTIAINCFPEFAGSQEERMTVLVNDTVPENRNGKTITLSVKSAVPRIDFHDFDSMFQENHVVDRIQDFECPKEIGPHTVFARQEAALYFRRIRVLSTHSTCFRLYNRGVVSANVDVHFLSDSLIPETAKQDTFQVEPRNERIAPMSQKTFTISFKPTAINTYQGNLQMIVALPIHLGEEKLFIKLVGESCVPEVAIVEPSHGKREMAALNFPRTLINEASGRYFSLENTGLIKAKVIVEIEEDLNDVFKLSPVSDSRHFLQLLDKDHDESNDRCVMILLSPENVARFKVAFSPDEIGTFYGKVRMHIIDNPYENLVINLEGESYLELVVLDGLEFDDNKRKKKSRTSSRLRRLSSKQNSLISIPANSSLPVTLTYNLDYGLCFVSKMYKKTFRIFNKSLDRWFRFQWGAHPHVVFMPTIGHLKYQTCKEVVATFLASEPINHSNVPIECSLCEIILVDSKGEAPWDDRQTEVKWEKVRPEIVEQMNEMELLAKKIVQPTAEPLHEITPGTSNSINLLLNATVAFSEYSCDVEEIHFKDTLMFQTREYKFTLTNPGIVNTLYAWKINMDEQYPKREQGDSLHTFSRRKIVTESSSQSPSNAKRIFSITTDFPHGKFDKYRQGGTGSVKLFSLPCTPLQYDARAVSTKSSAKKSDLFSSTAGLSGRTADSWVEDDLPFSISPETGMLSPQESVQFTLKFSPMDVFHYKAYLICRIDNIDRNKMNLTIPVVGRSLLPYCHFDIQESDYVTSGRRDGKLPGPVGYDIEDSSLWQNIRVIEFKVVGTGGTHVKKFHLINPTTDDYHFSWKDRTCRGVEDISNFHCTVMEGMAERGKQTDLAFTFLAENVGVFESFWLFSIARYNLKCLFLVVGIVTEPSVHCLTVHVKLKPTILGHNVRDSIRLLNNEDYDIPFAIFENSLYSEGKFQRLSVTPMTGVLVAKKEQFLWVEYHPTRVGEFYFSIQCGIKLMKRPLTVFVTAVVYEIVSSVSYISPGHEIAQAFQDKDNVIDLGRLIMESSTTIEFEVKNSGNVAFYYTWDLGITPEIASRDAYTILTSQKQGHVFSESQSTCCLTLKTLRKTIIKDHCVLLKITNGPSYRFLLRASSKKPALDFSFSRYDFGPCYIQENNGISYYKELLVQNSENVAFIVECKFEEKPHLSVDLASISQALAANSTISIPITFKPLKETKYRECLLFTINSANERKITILGEGITYKIRLVNPRDKCIDLGSVSVSRTVTRRIPVVNEGLASIDVRFDLLKNLSSYEQHRERSQCLTTQNVESTPIDLERASIMETKRSWTQDIALQTKEPRLSEVLKIEPSTNVVLKPNKRTNVLVTFKATSRITPFLSKVALQTGSTIMPLFVVQGSCVAAEFQLNRTRVSFGTVVQGYTSETRVVLMNTGDVGARFKWNTSKLPDVFKIDPLNGYCSPGMDITFMVSFQPYEEATTIDGEATIEIEKYGSLRTKITGGCCQLPEPTETILFESFVREKSVQSFVIMNDTHLSWTLKPEITGDYFIVEEVLKIPAKGFGSCVITYAPLTMNSEDNLHTGTLLLKLPDENTPILYSLHGRSFPPEATAIITRQFPAKTKYTESLTVQNWLNRQQRFICKIELLNNDEEQSKIPLFKFLGNNRIDVPANGRRDYRAVFYSYEESEFNFKVSFINEDNEYQFYNINYEVTKPEVIESIKLTASARSKVCHELKVENPLENKTILYTANCDHPFIAIRELPKTVPPMSHEYIYVLYCPMIPSEETITMLNVNSPELGQFPYELRLKALPPPPEKVTRVNATLGSTCIFPLLVHNYTKEPAEFVINVDDDCFVSQKSISVLQLDNRTIEVIFEPSNLENTTATLRASSKTAGDYIFPLIGICSLPKPMGPYIITRDIPASILFKNVFREEKTFEFHVDPSEIFEIEIPSTMLHSKQNIEIKVHLRKEEEVVDKETVMEEKYPVTGKLMVYCIDHTLSHVNWIYYVKGIFE